MSVIPKARCLKCNNEYEDSDEGPSCTCCWADAQPIFNAGFIAALNAARDTIRPINDAEELSKETEAQWERLRALIEAAKKEVEG